MKEKVRAGGLRNCREGFESDREGKGEHCPLRVQYIAANALL